MRELLAFAIAGAVAGSAYGLAATGLVLTYKTSGIFNFAHGAVAAAGAYAFYDLRDRAGWPALASALVAVMIVGPLLGLAFSLLAGRLRAAPTARRIVGTIGALLTIVGVLQLRYGVSGRTLASSLPQSTFRVAGLNIGWDQVITASIAALAIAGLTLLLRLTTLGVEMRAIVDGDELLGLCGRSPGRVRATSWMIGSAFAALSGVLLAPFVGLDALVLTLVVVAAFGAAAIGRFDHLLLTFAAGIGIGVAQGVLDAPPTHSAFRFLDRVQGLDQAIPFLVLFAVLVFRTGPAGVHVDRRAPRVTVRLPVPVAALLLAAVVVVVAIVPAAWPARLPVATLALVFVVINASLFLLVDLSNQLSLCHSAFVALGAVTFCHLATGAGWSWPIAVLASAAVAAPIGALVALLVARRSGLHLALATFAFAILVERLAYTRGFMFGVGGIRTGHRPHAFGFDSARGYFFLCAAVAATALVIVDALRRRRLGRFLDAAADSPVAVATNGAHVLVSRTLAFAVSAAMAAVAGALYVGVTGSVSSSGASPTALLSFNSLVWLTVLVICGRRVVATPIIAAVALVVVPTFITSPEVAQYLTVVFGIVAVVLCGTGDQIASQISAAERAGRDRVDRSPVRERTVTAGISHG